MERPDEISGGGRVDDPGDFYLGINYWPRRKAMYWWKSFDAAEVDEEFAQIASLGAYLVRFFLLWEDFQPTETLVDSRQLDHLVTVLDIAEKHGLQVVPTLLVGNMSGVIWLPEWAYEDAPKENANLQISGGRYVDLRPRSPFDDDGMLHAQDLLAESVASVTIHHPALRSWDLANEFDVLRPPCSPQSGWVWTRLLAQSIQTVSGDILVTYGAHTRSLTTRGLTIPVLSDSLDYLAMHGYPLYSDVARGPLDPEFVPFVTALTAELSGQRVMMQEFGICTAAPGEPSHWIEDLFLGEQRRQFLASEEDAAAYYVAVLDRLWQTGAMGALAWNYADYTPDLWTRPPLDLAIRERTFGLVRSDGSLKPAAEVFQRFASQLESGALERRLGPHGGARPILSVDPEQYYEQPAESFRSAYAEYLAQVER